VQALFYKLKLALKSLEFLISGGGLATPPALYDEGIDQRPEGDNEQKWRGVFHR
jgi:hypothetical protein